MKTVYRAALYTVGMIVLAVGLTLNTKTGLGVSPMMSMPYSISQLWHLNFGDMTFLMYLVFVAAQFVLRGKKSQFRDLLQLPLSLVFSRALNVCNEMITYDHTLNGIGMNLVVLLMAIVLAGVGVAMTINMNLVPNPGDGIVQAAAEKMGKDQGFTKNLFDLGSVLITVTISLLASGHVVGVGIGTVATMIGVGRVIALVNRFSQKKMRTAAGLAC